MRKLIAITAMLCTSFGAYAQDVITKTDGTTVKAKVTEVSDDVVSYKKWSNLDGPLYKIKTSNITSIKYKNGDVDKFDNPAPAPVPAPAAATPAPVVAVAPAPAPAATPAPVAAAPVAAAPTGYYKTGASANNAKQLAKYNSLQVTSVEQKSGKTTDDYVLVYRLTDNSVLDNGDLCVNFISSPIQYPKWIDNEKGHYFGMFCTELSVKNNTNFTIYIDNNQSTILQGGRTTYFSDSGNNKNRRMSSERFTVIAPHQEKQISLPGNFKTCGIGTFTKKLGKDEIGSVKKYDENSTPDKLTFDLLYAKDMSFTSYTSITFSPYIGETIAVKDLPTSKGSASKLDKMINGATYQTPLVTTYEQR